MGLHDVKLLAMPAHLNVRSPLWRFELKELFVLLLVVCATLWVAEKGLRAFCERRREEHQQDAKRIEVELASLESRSEHFQLDAHNDDVPVY